MEEPGFKLGHLVREVDMPSSGSIQMPEIQSLDFKENEEKPTPTKKRVLRNYIIA